MNDLPQRICPGCRVSLDRKPWALDRDLRASPECWHAFGEVVSFETAHPALAARHQLTLDTYDAQHAGAPSPVVNVTSALVGLQLAVACGVDDAAVWGARLRMGQPQSWWPVFEPPPAPGVLTVVDLLRAGASSDSVQGHAVWLTKWAASVWKSWSARHVEIEALTQRLFPGEFATA